MLARERGGNTAMLDAKIGLLKQEAMIQGITPIELEIALKQMSEQTSPEHFRSGLTSNRRTSRGARERRTSRSLRSNATCPSCGSPHYYEGMWSRDCATPDCIYFRGGTASGDPESPAARPTGSRRLGVTVEVIHASEPDEYPEIDGDQEEDIVIEADDLDEDETFAEKAASIIIDELGHVESSEYPGPGRWYTQSDPSEDYSTGDSTRKSIHVDNETWSDEEQQQIWDELKRRRMV